MSNTTKTPKPHITRKVRRASKEGVHVTHVWLKRHVGHARKVRHKESRAQEKTYQTCLIVLSKLDIYVITSQEKIVKK